MGRKSVHSGVSALGGDRIQFDFEFEGVRYRPTLKRSPTEANLKRARKQLGAIKQRIDAGSFVFAEEFPDYRFIKNVELPQKRRTCDQVFDEFLLACDSRVAKKDLAYVTAQWYRKLLGQIWRPEIGPRIFEEIRYSELAKIANAYQWSKKTYNNAISVVRCAFDYGYRDHPEKHNPASGLSCLRMTKKDRPPVAPFTIQEAEGLISRLHADWGGAIGNYDEFRLFTGLRPSEQIALLVTDYDARRAVLSVTKARVLRRDKDAPRRRRIATLSFARAPSKFLGGTWHSGTNTWMPAKSAMSIFSSSTTEGRSAIRKSRAGAGVRASPRSAFAGAGPTTRAIPR